MYAILRGDEINDRSRYPAWCNLSWFCNCRDSDSSVELHYHDMAEIWLWHKGSATGVVAGEYVELHPRVMLYTPEKCLHGYHCHGVHSNTGISPRIPAGGRPGHLHFQETGEKLESPMSHVFLAPEANNAGKPAELPKSAFLRHAYADRFAANAVVWDRACDAWTGILVRVGSVAGDLDNENLRLGEDELLILPEGCRPALRAACDSEVAFAVGWPASSDRDP